MDDTGAPCRNRLKTRVSGHFGNGIGVGQGLQRRPDGPNLKVVQRDDPVCVAEPPALLRALQQLHRLPALSDAFERLPGQRTVLRQETIRLALCRRISASVGFGDGPLSILSRTLTIGQEAVGPTEQEVVVTGQGGIL
jgi:hypothetical protein